MNNTRRKAISGLTPRLEDIRSEIEEALSVDSLSNRF